MRWRNSPEQWGAVARAFHWAIALFIIANIPLGLWADALPLSPTKVEAFYWHKSIGLTVLWLALLRLLWRAANPTPRLPAIMPRWERMLAHASHALLYGAMIAMPLSGWVIHSASGFPLDLYGVISVPDIVPGNLDDGAVEDGAATVHHWIFILICVLLTLHLAGAFKHHFIDRDEVLRRMLPFARASTRADTPNRSVTRAPDEGKR
ncbi:MAG: cytochrome b [Halofilum sp. (in: g-proteobacteria)]